MGSTAIVEEYSGYIDTLRQGSHFKTSTRLSSHKLAICSV